MQESTHVLDRLGDRRGMGDTRTTSRRGQVRHSPIARVEILLHQAHIYLGGDALCRCTQLHLHRPSRGQEICRHFRRHVGARHLQWLFVSSLVPVGTDARLCNTLAPEISYRV